MLLLVVVFIDLDMTINWNKGKTECCLLYRGRGATEALANRRQPDGSYAITVPACGSHDQYRGVVLHVVHWYKHLGTIIACDGSDILDAQLHSGAAMNAYAPLACKIFGSSRVGVNLKLILFFALVLSRLLYNVAIKVPSRRFLQIVNAVYMRGMRHIKGNC